MENLDKFNADQTEIINRSVAISEELVCDFYKMSAYQWLRHLYDVKTLVDLAPEEIVHGPFAQIVRYQGRRKNTSLGSSTYDFYKICLQDHTILKALSNEHLLKLEPFSLYIITHELVHIVRFSKFLQSFDASDDEKLAEERRVHTITRDICSGVRLAGMDHVLAFYRLWH